MPDPVYSQCEHVLRFPRVSSVLSSQRVSQPSVLEGLGEVCCEVLSLPPILQIRELRQRLWLAPSAKEYILMTGPWEIFASLGGSKRIKWGKKLSFFFYFLNKNYERQLNKRKFLSFNFVSLACSIFKISFIIHIPYVPPTANTPSELIMLTRQHLASERCLELFHV